MKKGKQVMHVSCYLTFLEYEAQKALTKNEDAK